MNDMGSCSFAGLRDRGSFLQLFSVESGFCSRARTMGSSAAGWHRRRSAQHCQGGSVAICYLVVSSTFSHCPQPHQETGRVCAFTALQLWLFLWCDLLHFRQNWLKLVLCTVHSSSSKNIKNALNLDLVITLVSLILNAL